MAASTFIGNGSVSVTTSKVIYKKNSNKLKVILLSFNCLATVLSSYGPTSGHKTVNPLRKKVLCFLS